MTSPREVTGSPKYQGLDENRIYTFEWAAEGTPSSPVVTLKDPYGRDKSTLLVGVAVVAGTTVVCPDVVGTTLTAGEWRLKCKATVSGKPVSAYLRIIVEE